MHLGGEEVKILKKILLYLVLAVGLFFLLVALVGVFKLHETGVGPIVVGLLIGLPLTIYSYKKLFPKKVENDKINPQGENIPSADESQIVDTDDTEDDTNAEAGSGVDTETETNTDKPKGVFGVLGILDQISANVRNQYFLFKNGNISEKLLSASTLILVAGVAVIFTLGGPITIYSFWLFVAGVLTSCLCPCIGFGMAGSAIAAWAWFAYTVGSISFYLLIVVCILSFLGILTNTFMKSIRNKSHIIYFSVYLVFSFFICNALYPIVYPLASLGSNSHKQNEETNSDTINLQNPSTYIGEYTHTEYAGGLSVTFTYEFLSANSLREKADNSDKGYEYHDITIEENLINSDDGFYFLPSGSNFSVYKDGLYLWTIYKQKE
jgi:hypothetical protein